MKLQTEGKIMSKKYVIGSDHAGYELKADLIKHLSDQYIQAKDIGPFNDDSVDYPEYGHNVAQEVDKDPKNTIGILICGTGIGMSIIANRYQNVRAALVHSYYTAEMARKHNDANIVVFGARSTTSIEAKQLLNVFLNTRFESGRHQRRLEQI